MQRSVSGRLLAKWGQGEALVSAATFHHDPEKSENRRFATLVCLANEFAHLYEQVLQKRNRETQAHISAKRLESLEMSKSCVENVMEAIHKRTAEVEVLVAIM